MKKILLVIVAAFGLRAETWVSPAITAAGELDLVGVPLALPKFDGNLGTLQSVRVVISGVAVTNNVEIRSGMAFPAAYSVALSETLTVSSLVTEPAVYQFSDTFAGTVDPGATVTGQHVLTGGASTFWSDQTIVLSAFTGAGSYVFTVDTVSPVAGNLPPNCGVSYYGTAGVTAQVTYTYAPSCIDKDKDDDGDDCDDDKRPRKHRKPKK
jgi:hypothetical protein